jgi:DHA3 family macrolide efflux protein-like MFS transporter
MNFRYDPVRDVVKSRALLADRRFASLWLAQGVAQTAQNAVLFSLLVIVLNLTGSSVQTSILVLCFIVPSIPMGFVVGVVLDRVDKGPVLIITSLARAGCCVLFLFFNDQELAIYGISILFAIAGLFFNPAVVSLVPALVSRDRLVSANSLYNFTLTGSQLVGIVFVAPTLLKLVGEDGMFVTMIVMFLIAAALSYRLRNVPSERDPAAQDGDIWSRIPSEFRETWKQLVADRYSSLALAQLIVSSTLVLLFAILIPRYMSDVIDAPPDNAAFVFAPAGIAALVGLRFIPWFARHGKNRVVVIGLVGIAISVLLLAAVEPIANVTEQAPASDYFVRQLRVSLLQALAMIFAALMGFFYSLLNAPAQTVLHERAPPEMRGRIFASQVISANLISFLPLLIIGAVTDLLNVPLVLAGLAIALLVMAAVSHFVGGREMPPPDQPADAPSDAEREGSSIDTPQEVR